MSYKTQHFSKCIFNPMEKDLLGKYPGLGELSKDERILRYVIALYDNNSPYILQQRDVRVRKQMVAQFAGYNVVADQELLESFYTLKNEEVRKAVVDFLKKYTFPRVWYMICANEQTFYEYGERLMEPIGARNEGGAPSAGMKEKDEMAAIQIKSKLSQDMEALNDRIEKGYQKLFSNDEDVDLPTLTGRTGAENMAMNV
jgi:hypothetical protein